MCQDQASNHSSSLPIHFAEALSENFGPRLPPRLQKHLMTDCVKNKEHNSELRIEISSGATEQTKSTKNVDPRTGLAERICELEVRFAESGKVKALDEGR
jgi:hypothetical protein